MKIQYMTIRTERYGISCKYSLPESGRISGVILGVHGFGGSKESSTLAAVAEAVDKRDVALVSFDFPAHGASPAHEDQFTVENCRQDVLYMADLCRREFPTAERYLFATSFGGFVALLCAEQLEDFRTVLRAPAVTMPQQLLPRILGMTAEEFQENSPVKCGYDRPLMLPYSFYVEAQEFNVMEGDYLLPMLVIHGDEDEIVPPEDVQAFCQKHRAMSLRVIRGAGHHLREGEVSQVVDCACAFWFSEEDDGATVSLR